MSLGKGIGQQTGGTLSSDSAEARRILAVIEQVSIGDIEDYCGAKAAKFVYDMRQWLAETGGCMLTGKQLFFLREVKDQLVEKGII